VCVQISETFTGYTHNSDSVWISCVISASGPQLSVSLTKHHWERSGSWWTWPRYKPQQHDPARPLMMMSIGYSLKEIFPLRRIALFFVYERQKRVNLIGNVCKESKMIWVSVWWLSGCRVFQISVGKKNWDAISVFYYMYP